MPDTPCPGCGVWRHDPRCIAAIEAAHIDALTAAVSDLNVYPNSWQQSPDEMVSRESVLAILGGEPTGSDWTDPKG